MVDVLSTRLQTVYNTWEHIQQPDNRLSPSIINEIARKRVQRERKAHEPKTSLQQEVDFNSFFRINRRETRCNPAFYYFF